MRGQQRVARHWLVLLSLVVALGLGGCTIQLVADYDSATFEETLKVAKTVDRFYGDLLEASGKDRAYAKYAARYVEIETDIRSLVTRNQARPLNDESTDISLTILKLWVKYKQAHHARNDYPSGKARLDRGRFVRLFNAAAAAEKAKMLDPGDLDTEQESQDSK